MTQPQTLGTRVEGPSELITNMIQVAPFSARNAMQQRVSQQREVGLSALSATFLNWQEQILGIGMNRYARAVANNYLDERWERTGPPPATAPEVIIGSGYHAAVYAAIRVQSGHPRPIVLERNTTVGGTFAMVNDAVFYLNSSNRPGPSGLSQRLGVNLNHLPGAPIQVDQLSDDEYQTNADMAFVIRVTLAQYADVYTSRDVMATERAGEGVQLTFQTGETMRAGRVIDARGLGDPVTVGATSDRVQTFPQFMERMAGMWPLRNIRRVVVAGDGDSAKCAVEALLGLGPARMRSAGGLDRVERVDWYARGLPTSFDAWGSDVRGRYIRIGRQLRSGEYGRRLDVIQRRMPYPVQLPDGVLVEGRRYDLAVMCIGNRENTIDGAFRADFVTFVAPGADDPVALMHYDYPIFRVGPHARLPFTGRERLDTLGGIANNMVSMFRTGPMTAALAASLGPVDSPADSETDGPEDEYDGDDSYYGFDD